jgi:hypothetical protein
MEKYTKQKYKRKRMISSSENIEQKFHLLKKPETGASFEKTIYVIMKNGNTPVNAKEISEISEKLNLSLNQNTIAGIFFSKKKYFIKHRPGYFTVNEKLFNFGNLFKNEKIEIILEDEKLEEENESEEVEEVQPKKKMKLGEKSNQILELSKKKLDKKPTTGIFEQTVYIMMKNGNLPVNANEIVKIGEKLKIFLLGKTISANFTKKSNYFLKESPGFYTVNEKLFDFGNLFKKEIP